MQRLEGVSMHNQCRESVLPHLHTRGPGVHSRIKNRNDDTSPIVFGIFVEELSDTRLFLRQQAPDRKITIDGFCHVSSAADTVTVGKPLCDVSFVLPQSYISIKQSDLRVRNALLLRLCAVNVISDR